MTQLLFWSSWILLPQAINRKSGNGCIKHWMSHLVSFRLEPRSGPNSSSQPTHRGEWRHISAKPWMCWNLYVYVLAHDSSNPAAWSAAIKLPIYDGPPALQRQFCMQRSLLSGQQWFVICICLDFCEDQITSCYILTFRLLLRLSAMCSLVRIRHKQCCVLWGLGKDKIDMFSLKT